MAPHLGSTVELPLYVQVSGMPCFSLVCWAVAQIRERFPPPLPHSSLSMSYRKAGSRVLRVKELATFSPDGHSRERTIHITWAAGLSWPWLMGFLIS